MRIRSYRVCAVLTDEEYSQLTDGKSTLVDEAGNRFSLHTKGQAPNTAFFIHVVPPQGELRFQP